MNSLPMITVGIPIYNAEAYLDNAIKSVLAQSYSHWELILINDGSSDGSMEIAKKYSENDSRIRVFDDNFNRKLPYRLNQIIELSKYDYIARMDADDIMHPERLYEQINYILNNNIDLVATSYYSIGMHNNVIDERIFNIYKFSKNDFIKGNHFICHPSILAKKSWFLRNHYDTKYERAEDYELWLRSTLNNDFKAHVIPKSLMFYREDGSINKNKLLNSYKTTLLIFKDKKDNFSFLEYLYVVFLNFFKFFFVMIFYSKYFEKILIARRSKKKLLNSRESEDLKYFLNQFLNSKY